MWVWPGNYTKFCLGSAYMLVGLNASALLLDHLSETNFFHSGNFRKMGEDVVWTGFVAEKANINRTHVVGFSPQAKLAYHCFADGEKAALTVHYIKGLENITKYWKWMRTPGKCVPNTESSGWFPFSYFMYFDYNAARDKLIKRH
uniref:Uncharacterized protein n=1 Tax=Plectus sambesii TaxID=2011161 RepID=A0A914XVS1_9BILA